MKTTALLRLRESMDALYGAGACRELTIRPVGGAVPGGSQEGDYV